MAASVTPNTLPGTAFGATSATAVVNASCVHMSVPEITNRSDSTGPATRQCAAKSRSNMPGTISATSIRCSTNVACNDSTDTCSSCGRNTTVCPNAKARVMSPIDTSNPGPDIDNTGPGPPKAANPSRQPAT